MKLKSLFFLITFSIVIKAQIPRPDHVVMVMFENKGYSQIVGSSSAPFINALISDTNTALLSNSYALTHPSQPNYIRLYSGAEQGVYDNNLPANTPFTTCNLGASLLAGEFTFKGYSESMPSEGFLGSTSLYVRRHNPWSNWQGYQANNIPPSVNQPFTAFPSDFNQLADVSIVVPNLINCMHDGSVQDGDTWLATNMNGYIQWAKTHNSLLIVTFDEDNGAENNHVLTFFNGPMVKSGSYSTYINHYNLLRTLEDMYNLSPCGYSSHKQAVNFIWKSKTTPVIEIKDLIIDVTIWPVPSKDQFKISVNTTQPVNDITISLIDLLGKSLKIKTTSLAAGENIFEFNINELETGVYFFNISGKGINYHKKVVVK
ncbi:MAG: acid phosphatase [Bacteroidetes bacterium]|nr:acid phosphatase [Bacteroidota bacterium]